MVCCSAVGLCRSVVSGYCREVVPYPYHNRTILSRGSCIVQREGIAKVFAWRTDHHEYPLHNSDACPARLGVHCLGGAAMLEGDCVDGRGSIVNDDGRRYLGNSKTVLSMGGVFSLSLTAPDTKANWKTVKCTAVGY